MDKRKPLKTLFVSAFAPELAPRARLGRRHFVVRGDTGYLAAGIGPVAATFGLTHFLEDYRPETIVGIGTAGTYVPGRFAVGEVVAVKSISTASGLDAVYTPKKQVSRLRIKPFGTVHSANVFCPQEITTSAAHARRLARAGHHVENLEAFALAFVAQKFRIPFTMIVGISNRVGPAAHTEWKKHGAKVMKKVWEILKV